MRANSASECFDINNLTFRCIPITLLTHSTERRNVICSLEVSLSCCKAELIYDFLAVLNSSGLLVSVACNAFQTI